MIFDILVIGDGILGLSTAYALSMEDSTLRIGIVGSHNDTKGATPAAGAMLGCFGEVTAPNLESEYGLAKLDMAVQAAQIWPQWLNQINNSIKCNEKLFITPGTFVLLNTSSGSLDEKNYNAIVKALQMYNEAYEDVDPRDIPGMNSAENSRPLKALYMPNEGSIKPQNLISALHEIIDNNKNITFIDDTVLKVNLIADKISSVQTKIGNSITAATFLLAAGAYSQNLLDQIPQLKYKIPRILFGTGTSIILKYAEHHFTHVVRSPNRAGSCGAHIVPHDEHTLYMGATNNLRITEGLYPKARDIYYLLERAIEQFGQKLHKSEVIKWQVGNRPVTVDTFPLIGKASISNLWLLTGTYRDGIHLSPVLAETMAKEILGSSTLNLGNKFTPERKPITIYNKQGAIQAFVEHCVSAGHEHSIKLPKIGWDVFFQEMWEQRAHNLYSQLGTEIGLSPDLLFMLDQEPDSIHFLKEYYYRVSQLDNNLVFANQFINKSKQMA